MLNHVTYVHTFPEIQTPSLRLNLRLDSRLFEFVHLAVNGVYRSVGIGGSIIETQPRGVHVRFCLD